MKHLEIIHLRSAGEPLKALGELIAESVGELGADQEVVTLYRRDELDTDLAVHIVRSILRGRQEPSDLAMRLASALKAYGLVEHTLWKEMG
jgi:hypothetical protein